MAAVMAQTMNKRKRDSQDLPNIRPAPGLGPDASDFAQQYLHTDDDHIDSTDANVDFAAVLAQHSNVGPSGNEQANNDAHAHIQSRAHQAQAQAQTQPGQRPGQNASDYRFS